MFFTLFFVLVTVLIISSSILIMVFDYQDMGNSVEIKSQQEEQPSEYWTKERMEEAEPQPMPTVSEIDKLKELVRDTLPILIILFIILTAVLTLMNTRKIKLLEKQNKNILNELSNVDDTWNGWFIKQSGAFVVKRICAFLKQSGHIAEKFLLGYSTELGEEDIIFEF